MVSVSVKADRLAQRAASIVDSSMRIAYIRHLLQRMDVVQVADLIIVTKANAEARNPTHSKLLLNLSLALADQSCEHLRQAVAALLESRDQHELARMLRRIPAVTDRENIRIPDFGLGRQVTLGERKALARRNNREIIARAIRDPSASVIRVLLENPALTESDVLKLCSQRPMAQEVLREVFHNWRWIVRYRVKMAIVLNPHTPLDIALQLIPHLKAQDKRRVVETPNLAKELYESCQRNPSNRGIH
ncbi:MAG: hypothetical protein JXA30_13670 [Deltaproteobacteria bacterium]|nr:hypothetical protein [Deltaproteobacteria bacterium]